MMMMLVMCLDMKVGLILCRLKVLKFELESGEEFFLLFVCVKIGNDKIIVKNILIILCIIDILFFVIFNCVVC